MPKFELFATDLQLKQSPLEHLFTCSAKDKHLTLLGKVEGINSNKEGPRGESIVIVGLDLGWWEWETIAL